MTFDELMAGKKQPATSTSVTAPVTKAMTFNDLIAGAATPPAPQKTTPFVGGSLASAAQTLGPKLVKTGQTTLDRTRAALNVAQEGQKAGLMTPKGILKTGEAGLQAGGAIAGAVTGGAMDIASSITPQPIKDVAKGLIGLFANTPVAQKVVPAISDWAAKHPEAAANLQSIIDIASVGVGGEAEQIGKKGLEVAGKQVERAVPKIAERLGVKGTEEEATANILKTISPKATTKEAKIATMEGRLVKGKEPTLLKSGTADSVYPTSKETQIVRTIKDNIPNADNLTEPQMYNELSNSISRISDTLEPEMKSVNLDKSIASKISDRWKTLKESQLKEPDFLDNKASNKVVQNQFERRLDDLKQKKTINDLWQSAKDYDASIPDSVKKANNMSDAKLQFRKQMWLDNRSILRDAINDATKDLSQPSQKAFSDMHDMYSAQESILTKAKIETEVKPSKLKQFAKEHPVVTGLGAAGAASALGFTGGAKEAARRFITGQ